MITISCSSRRAADSYGYDTADRLQPNPTTRCTLRYDQLGRTRTLPSVDTVDGGGDLSIDYYTSDLVAGLTHAGRTSSYTLDPQQRRSTRTDTTTAAPTPAVTISHYDDDTDNPDWTDEPDGSWTRNTTGIGAGLAATVSSTGAITLQLADLHGDILATLPVTATTPTDMTMQESTEYGLPRIAPSPGSLLPRYGYLGAAQRDTSNPGGLTLMGARLYTPTLGRFLQTDPVEGGSANNYDYCDADPVGCTNLNGQCGWHSVARFVQQHWKAIVVVAVVVWFALRCQILRRHNFADKCDRGSYRRRGGNGGGKRRT